MRTVTNPARRRGFSFVELLVVLAIMAVLAAIIAPSIIDRSRDAEVQRFSESLHNLRTASTMFVQHTTAYPGRPSQFFIQPVGGTSKDLFNATMSNGKTSKWRGPYLDTDSLKYFHPTTQAFALVLTDSFTVKSSDGNQYMTVIFTGAARTDQLRLKADLDGGAGVAAADSATGLLRYKKDSLFVLLTPAR